MRKITASLAFAGVLAVAAAGLAQTPTANYPIFFQKNSATIDSNGASTIAIAAKAAQANPKDQVIVTGSSDTTVSASVGHRLGTARAKAVAAALAADGVDPARIAIVSTGPLSAPGVPSGIAAQFSRRVLIKIGD